MEMLTAGAAQRLINAALAMAREDGGLPVCVAVSDKQGFLLAFARMDGAPLRSIQISQCKAYTATRMGVTTEAFLARLRNDKIEVGYFCDPLFTPLPGGTPLLSPSGALIGAVGVSGRSVQDDQKLTDALAAMLREDRLQS